MTPTMNLMLPTMAFILTILAMTIQFSHLLMSLFCLENMLLCLVLAIPMLTTMNNMMLPQLSMILLTFGACEASLGLSIMVIMSRTYGTDMLNSLSTNKC